MPVGRIKHRHKFCGRCQTVMPPKTEKCPICGFKFKKSRLKMYLDRFQQTVMLFTSKKLK